MKTATVEDLNLRPPIAIPKTCGYKKVTRAAYETTR